ncbi:Pkinase-domain-containing protein [Mycena sanguinolenta]|nr:Pkinase-domain-containing protein [Mycena sanguinolenta]
MPSSSKRPASRSPEGERRPKRALTSSPPEEGEVDDDGPQPTASKPAVGPISLKNNVKIPFPFKKKNTAAAPPLMQNVFEAKESAAHDRLKEEDRRSRDADSKRKAPRASEHSETASSSNRHHSSRNTRDRRSSLSPSPRRSSSPSHSVRHRLGHHQDHSRFPSPKGREPLSWPPTNYEERSRDGRYEDRDRDRGHRRQDGRGGAWSRRDDGWNDYHDRYERSPPREYRGDSYRPMSPQYVNYRPTSPRTSTRPPSPRAPLSPPRTRAHSPQHSQPPPPTTSPPPPPPPDTRLQGRLPPPPPSLPPKPPAPIANRSPRTMDPPPPSMPQPPPPPPLEVRKEPARIIRQLPPPRRSQMEEEKAYARIFKGCGYQNDYQVTTKLGEGTFGEVHKAIHTATGRAVALKRILMHNEKEGMPVTALREIKILKALNHPAIVNILDMFVVRSTPTDAVSVYMVFPYMDHDLAGLLENERVKLQPSHIKLYMKQLLEGTEYMHRNHILHRDMKAANLLISNSGTLLIADFGLARAFDSGDNPNRGGKERKYTNCVVTRWYRPPELLLGARQYGGEVDMWGIGCVLGEMFMRRPILPGTSDLDQLEKIWVLCGTPNQHSWPNFDSLPGCDGVKRFTSIHPRKVKANYEHIGKETCDLLDRLLTCNPLKRITAAQALDHDYFWTDPMPADPKTLPQYEASHEFDKRGRHHQHHHQQQHQQQQQQQQSQQHGPPPPYMDPHRQYRPPPPGAIPPQPPPPDSWQPRPSYNNPRPPPGYGPGPGPPGPPHPNSYPHPHQNPSNWPPPAQQRHGARGPELPPNPNNWQPRSSDSNQNPNNWQRRRDRDGYDSRGGGGGGGGRPPPPGNLPPGLPARPLAPQGVPQRGRPSEGLNYG